MADERDMHEVDLPNPDHPKLQQSHEGEHHGDFGSIAIPINRSTKIFALCAAVNSCNLGYDIGMSTTSGNLIQDDLGLSDGEREILLGSLNFWAMFGAMSSQYFSDKFGRRKTFIVAAIGFIVGTLIMAAGPNYTVLMIGRCLVGLGVGVGMAIDPVYISEISPAQHRGYLVTWSEIAINVGILLGFSMGLFLADLAIDLQWRLMFIFGAILPCVMIFLVLKVMPESPRWLVAQQREPEAKEVLAQVYPPGFNVDLVTEDIRESLERERIAEETTGWSVLLYPSPAFRRMFMIGWVVAIAQQATGVDALQYYLVDVIDSSGVHDERDQALILIGLGIIKLGFILVGGKFFDIRGRRPLFFASLIGMAIALFLLSILYYANSASEPSTTLLVIFLALYLASFSIAMGPGAWLIPSEVFTTSIRAKAMSIATMLNRATATLMSSTFLSTKNTIGWGGFFMLMCAASLVICGFLFVFLPETKGRSLEDMSVYFAELTGDNSILEAEKKLRDGGTGETEMISVVEGNKNWVRAGNSPTGGNKEGGTLT